VHVDGHVQGVHADFTSSHAEGLDEAVHVLPYGVWPDIPVAYLVG
jgi:hypothetical protein